MFHDIDNLNMTQAKARLTMFATAISDRLILNDLDNDLDSSITRARYDNRASAINRMYNTRVTESVIWYTEIGISVEGTHTAFTA